ncbi:MAG: fasciclin domain-containing protein, partial [Gammaproteobacteria bacterium]|nr:fasciclin domain-containing protein [Gammaproteobacteria bacterium]
MKLRITALLAAAAMFVAGTALAGGHAAAKKDIVDTAVSAGTFNTLVAAVQAAELVDALKGEGPLTVFAPTDDAFAALPDGTVENLLKPENKAQLQAVLLYHVVSGKIMAADIGSGAQPATLQGATINVVGSSSGVTVNGANVVAADVMASNGVIHVIDAVI